MNHTRFSSRYNYQITIERIRHFSDLLPDNFYELQHCQFEVEKQFADDFRFLIQVREHMFIAKEESFEEHVVFDVVRVNEETSFKVTQEINPQNHPWIEEVIPVGTILMGSSNYDYGTVNWLEGIGLEVDQVCVQINRRCLKLK